MSEHDSYFGICFSSSDMKRASEPIFEYNGDLFLIDKKAIVSRHHVPHPNRGECVMTMFGMHEISDTATIIKEVVTVINIFTKKKMRIYKDLLNMWCEPFATDNKSLSGDLSSDTD